MTNRCGWMVTKHRDHAEPVKVTLLSGGKEISTYEYLTYNNIPGTVMLTHATELYDEGVTVKRNNDGKSFNSNLGNF